MYRYIIWKYNIYYICNDKVIFSPEIPFMLIIVCITTSQAANFIIHSNNNIKKVS